MTDISGTKVLIAEDDRSVRQSLQRALRYEGYDISLAVDGAEALEAVKDDRPDALILDIMMPHVDGLSVCRRIRSKGDDLPILMLTAKHEISDRVAGLDAGADDYLVKPFALEELLARLRALLRRTAPEDIGGPLTFADLSLDPETRRVERAGRLMELTKTEFDLLELLMLNSGIVLTREVIYERIWGYDFGTSSNSLDVYIGYLRRKTEAGGETRLIPTVRGVGYALRES
jgi:two-component system response regulator MprA